MFLPALFLNLFDYYYPQFHSHRLELEGGKVISNIKKMSRLDLI